MSKAVVEKVNTWIANENQNFKADNETAMAQNFFNAPSKVSVETTKITYSSNAVADAVKFKETGNKQFENQQFEAAIKSYSSALELDPANAIYPANRAMALIKVNRFKEALVDCDTALRLDPAYVKALLRRASVHAKLSNLTSAYLDYLKVLELEPANVQAKKEIDLLKKGGKLDLAAVERAQKGQTTAPNPTNKTEQKVPLTSTKAPNNNTPVSQSNESQRPTPKEASQTVSKVTSVANKPTEVNSAPKKELLEISEGKHSTTANRVDSAPVRTNNTSAKPDVNSIRPEASKKQKKMTEISDLEKEMEELKRRKVAIPTDPPVRYPEFEQIWKSLHDKRDKYQYFKIIPLSKFEEIFSETLDSDNFNAILGLILEFCLKEENNTDRALEYLSSFASMRRFSILIMFISDEEKQLLNQIFDFIQVATTDSQVLLRSKYFS